MFDIGWSEMAVIALIALIVIGPKDLPGTMKTVAHWMRKARSLTREFQSGVDDMVREAELDDAKKALEATRGGNLQKTIGNAIDPDDEVGGEVRSVEREAQRSDEAAGAAPSAAEGSADSNADRASATMVTQPANVAPPHSLTPPAEGGASDSESAPASSGEEGSKQTA